MHFSGAGLVVREVCYGQKASIEQLPSMLSKDGELDLISLTLARRALVSVSSFSWHGCAPLSNANL